MMHGTPTLRPTAKEIVTLAHTSISAIKEKELREGSACKAGAREGGKERGTGVGTGSGIGTVYGGDGFSNKEKGARGEAGGGGGGGLGPCSVTGSKVPSSTPVPVPPLKTSTSHKPSNRPFAHIFS